MKQIKLLITCVALATVLASCGRNDNDNNATTATTTPTNTPQQTEGVMDEMGNAVKDVTDGVGNSVKDMGDAVEKTTE